MSAKMGRPTDNPKYERITTRLDQESSEILSEYCVKNNVNKGEAVRIAIKKLKDDKKK